MDLLIADMLEALPSYRAILDQDWNLFFGYPFFTLELDRRVRYVLVEGAMLARHDWTISDSLPH